MAENSSGQRLAALEKSLQRLRERRNALGHDNATMVIKVYGHLLPDSEARLNERRRI